MLLAVLIVAACAPKIEEQETIVRKVKVSKPAKADTIVSRNFSGIIEEAAEVNLAFRVAGPIDKIHVNEGDYVIKGQLIATIDQRDYQLQYDVAKAQYEQVKAEYDRLSELKKRESVAANDYEKAVAGEKLTRLQLQRAEDQLNDTRLLAPFSGYIQSVKYQEKELVNTGMTLATLLNSSALQIEVDVPLEVYLQRNHFTGFSLQQEAIAADACPLILTGYSRKASNNQLYTFSFSLSPDAASKFTPGMSALVNISYRNHHELPLNLPLKAVFNYQGKSCVWLYTPKTKTVHRRQVETDGLTGKGNIRILSGIGENDLIVTAGVNALTEGEKVALVEKTSETNIGGLL